MLYLNGTIKDSSEFFSKEWRRVVFSLPNIYLADTLDDFLENKEDILGTRYSTWPFKAGELYQNKAIVVIGECAFREFEYSNDEIFGLFKRGMIIAKEYSDEILELYSAEWSQFSFPPNTDYLKYRADKFMFESSLNAKLYDGDTAIKILSSLTVPDETRIKDVELLYDPRLDFAELLRCKTKEGEVYSQDLKDRGRLLDFDDLYTFDFDKLE